MIMSASRIVLTYADVKRLIAHREPFLLISHVRENIIGKKLTAIGIQSHRPVVPHDLYVLEGLGQASAVLLRQMPEYEDKPFPAFAGMKNVVWTQEDADPQNELLFTVELKRRMRGKFGTIDAVAHLGDMQICSAELTFSFLRLDPEVKK